jgi:hypothetical protein
MEGIELCPVHWEGEVTRKEVHMFDSLALLGVGAFIAVVFFIMGRSIKS